MNELMKTSEHVHFDIEMTFIACQESERALRVLNA